MKKLLTLFALASLVFTACDNKDEQWTQVTLDGSELTAITVSPSTEAATVNINGGSGDYSVVIDEPSVADVSIEPSYGAGILLVIEPKGEGDAVVTVTDTKSGLFARCQLRVAEFTSFFEIDAVRVNVDAESPEAKEAIEADLEADKTVPTVGGKILRNYYDRHGGWAFVDADGEEIARGITVLTEFAEWNQAFDFLQPDSQVMSYGRWILSDEDGGEREFEMCICKGKFTRANASPANIVHARFYEDLTKEYQEKYPDAGVRSVARVLISNTF